MQLGPVLGASSDPDMVLNSLDLFVKGSRNPLALGALFERDREALPTLVQIFSASQHLSNLLIQDPESYDLLRLTEGQPVARQHVVDEIVAEVEALDTTPRSCGPCGASSIARRCGSPTATSSAIRA